MPIAAQRLWQKIGIGLSQVLLLYTFSITSMEDEYNSNWRGLAIDGYDVVAYFDQNKPVKKIPSNRLLGRKRPSLRQFDWPLANRNFFGKRTR